MDTTEQSGVAQTSAIYDGFISYSHAADDLLAPRLQSGLHRFAKPWWKRRAIRIFRDESSLSANPHLWSSITEALDQSDWFVLLLSPDAAESPWVSQEIEYWKEHKDPSRILPVLTGGTFEWLGGDVSGSAVPEQLEGAFSEEPRWVDMRFAKDEEQLDLQNPRFADAVADIASALRGVPKDELASEEVKQHRRTIRTAWAAGALLLLLGVAAVLAAMQASRNAQVAEARELAASAIAVLEEDPELATLLALEAIGESDNAADQPAEVINALWQAGSANRLIAEWDYAGTWHSDLSPDAQRFAYFDGPQELVLMDADTGEPIWAYTETDTVDFFDFPAIAPDGRVALLIVDSTSFLNPFQSEEADDQQARVVILDGETGMPLHTIPYKDCSTIWHPEWSPDGRYLVVSSGGSCDRGDGPAWVDVFETDGWERVETLVLPEATIAVRPRFDDTGALHVFSFQGLIYSFEPETFETRAGTGSTGFGDVFPAGESYLLAHSTTAEGGSAFSAYVVDVETGITNDVLYNGLDAPRMPATYVSRDGRLGIVGTDGPDTFVYNLTTNRLLHILRTGPLITASYDPDTSRLYTTGNDPGVKVWDVSGSPVGIDLTGELGDFTFVADDLRTMNSFVAGPSLIGMTTVDQSEPASLATLFFDRETGVLVGDPVRGLAVEYALPDGRFVMSDIAIGSVGNTASHSRMATTVVIWDPETGDSIELIACQETSEDPTGSRRCSGPDEPPKYRVFLSSDGEKVLAYGFADTGQPEYTGHFRALDAATGELVASYEPGDHPTSEDPLRSVARFGGLALFSDGWAYGGINDSGVAHDAETGEVLYRLEKIVSDIEASPDRRYIANVQNSVSVVVVDTESWAEVADIAADARVTGVAFNPDGSRLAVADLVGLRIVDNATGGVVQQIGLSNVADIHWIDDETIVVGTTDGQFGSVSLSTQEFLRETRERLRRSFTEQECLTYRIDPCPSLEEMRGR